MLQQELSQRQQSVQQLWKLRALTSGASIKSLFGHTTSLDQCRLESLPSLELSEVQQAAHIGELT